MFEAVTRALTGHRLDPTSAAPVSAAEFAAGLSRRNGPLRSRIVQIMVLGEMVLALLPPEFSDQVAAFADELGAADELLAVARSFAHGSLGMAAVDFERNGYLDGTAQGEALHTSAALQQAWDAVPDDPALAARWASLGDLDEGTVGRGAHEFHLSRGFVFPGRPGSAPPLLAQHDWVHVLADYGTTVENEIEVFGYIARANDDPRAFGLLAMIVSLFETGYLARGGQHRLPRARLVRRGRPAGGGAAPRARAATEVGRRCRRRQCRPLAGRRDQAPASSRQVGVSRRPTAAPTTPTAPRSPRTGPPTPGSPAPWRW